MRYARKTGYVYLEMSGMILNDDPVGVNDRFHLPTNNNMNHIRRYIINDPANWDKDEHYA